MLIDPDTSKLSQEVLFSRKKKIQNQSNISLNNIQVESASHQKHLGITHDEKRNFKENIDSTILKVNMNLAPLK